ncbi:hypothetical protein Hanom_Chr09g00849951 [Helianthus anomalus]
MWDYVINYFQFILHLPYKMPLTETQTKISHITVLFFLSFLDVISINIETKRED